LRLSARFMVVDSGGRGRARIHLALKNNNNDQIRSGRPGNSGPRARNTG